MLNRNKRLVAFTVAVVMILIVSSILPASAQLSQWRSLNPTRDGTIAPTGLGPILYSAQMLSPNVGWAVGGTCDIYASSISCPSSDRGFTLFWDGARWRQTLVPASAHTLTSVFIVSANDVWAVGMANTIIHWDGTSWVTAPIIPSTTTIDIFSVFFLPGGLDGWAVGKGGSANILRWSGIWPTGAWSVYTTTAPTKQLRSVFLVSPTDGWAAGAGGILYHWDGAGWTDLSSSSPTTNNLYSVFMVSPIDAWAVGASSTIIRWNGASWTGPMVPPTLGNDYRSIRMVNATSGWIASNKNAATDEGLLLKWDGTAWTLVRSWVTVPLNGVFMLPGGSVGCAVGEAETIIRWNGSTWFAQTSPTHAGLYAVGMVASNDGWAVGNGGTIFRYDGTSWAHYETLPSAVNLFGLHMRASNDGWAVGDSLASTSSSAFPPTILRWAGSAWTEVTPSGVAVGQALYAVDTVSATESWAVGSGRALSSPSSVPAVPATILKWDGTIWTSVPSGTPPGSSLFGIDMLSSTDGWAVGCTDPSASPACQSPIIVRWNGLAWSAITTPGSIHGLTGIFMLSPTNGWAVGWSAASGGQTTIIHWDGSQWTSVPGPIVGSGGGLLSSVYMVSATDGWAVGYDATSSGKSLIVHWDGMTWNVVATLPLPPTMAVSLNSVFMVTSLDGWIVSNQGLFLHYGPESVPGTTTSLSTVIQTTTSTTIETTTSTTSSSATTGTGTTTTMPPGQWGIPGFPIESILAGLVAGVAVLTALRHRPKRRS
jgi:hypothetical protein